MGRTRAGLATLAIVGASLWALGGCTYTQLQGYQDPAFADHTFHKIAVWFPTQDLGERQSVEDAVAQSLTKQGVDAVPSEMVIPPTRTYTDAQVLATLEQNGYDGVIRLDLSKVDYETDYVPSTSTTTADVHHQGDDTTVTKTTTQDGGYTESSVSDLKFTVRLEDVASGKTAWLGSSTTESGLMTWDVVASSLGDEMAKSLKKDGLI